MNVLKKLLVMTLLLSSFNAAMAVELAGVKVEEAMSLKGNPLVLNGAGIRYKAIFKVYVASLYLGKKASTPEEVLAQPGAKHMSVTMLRNIDANELGKLFSRGMEDNMPKAEFAKVIPSVLRMSQMFSDYKNLKAGDNFTIDWLPGVGTIISIKGKPYGEPFKEAEFFNALLRIWLGPNPPDWKLKDALLGKAT